MSGQQNDLFKVLKMLPHRYPMLLVDRILSFNPEEGLRGKITVLKNVSFNESFFQGHFPENPVMPGVLMLEGIAQSACLLAMELCVIDNSIPDLSSSTFFFAGMDKVRFKRVVSPGDQLVYTVELTKQKQNFWKFTGQAHVERGLAVRVESLLATAKKA